jgi:type IV pilus assembly protein PilC
MKDYCKPGFHPVALFFWFMFVGGPIGVLLYLTKLNQKIAANRSQRKRQ